MMKDEFVRALRSVTGDESADISADDYAIVEKVYTWHPAIHNVGGKHQIAEIFASGGMLVIRDMLPRAEKAEQLEPRISAICKDIAGMEQLISDLMAEIRG